MGNVKKGSCLCGTVGFEVSGELRGVVYCHCSQCRKQSGFVFAATDVDEKYLKVSGEENISWFQASDEAKRGFCKTCGSALFWKSLGSDKISIMAGAFDQPSGLSQDSHIFVSDKGDFYEIHDDLPQFAHSKNNT